MPLSIEKRREIDNLFKRFKDDRSVEVTQEIAEKSMGLVLYVINLYFCNVVCFSDKQDYIQEGNLALMQAIKTWDSSKGNFEGYAISAIKGRLMNMSVNLITGGIYISQRDRVKFVSLRKKYLPLRVARLPDWHICEKLGINEKQLRELEAFLAVGSRIYFDASKNPDNIARERRQFEEMMLEIFEGSNQEDHNCINEIEEALLQLPISERARLIFCQRYGLLGCNQRMLKDIAKDFNVKIGTIESTIGFVRSRLENICKILEAKNWLKINLSILSQAMREVMVLHYGLDKKIPMSHCDIAEMLGIKIGTSRYYLENAWKRLSVVSQAREMRKVLWWKDV